MQPPCGGWESLSKAVGLRVAYLGDTANTAQVVGAGVSSAGGGGAEFGVRERVDGFGGDAVAVAVDLLRRSGAGGGGLVGTVKTAGAGGRGHVLAELGGGEGMVLVELEDNACQKAKSEDEDDACGLSHGKHSVLRLGCGEGVVDSQVILVGTGLRPLLTQCYYADRSCREWTQGAGFETSFHS